MRELTDVLYPVACWNAWQEGDEYAAVELLRGLCSPNLIVRVITRAILKDSPLQNLADNKAVKRYSPSLANSDQFAPS